MLDAAFIKACTDPSLKPAIVRQFVETVGADNPLTVTVKSGDRLVLVPMPRSSTEAIELVRHYLGRASVRVGLTQYPAGIGITNIGDQQPGIIEPCDNLKMGTAMFAKIMRIVAKSFGASNRENGSAHIFEAATEAWRVGSFEGMPVFSAPDPGNDPDKSADNAAPEGKTGSTGLEPAGGTPPAEQDIGNAGIRIDLTRIGGQK